jgi:hypothetical protein
MAKRGRKPAGTLEVMIKQLRKIDAERTQLVTRIRDAANSLLVGLSASSGGTDPVGIVKPLDAAPRKRKPMSAAGRAKIAAAQRARWAKQKKTKNG